MISIMYAHPRIYELGLKLVHGRHLSERYSYIASQIGREKSVLEPACGPALLEPYIDNGHYFGFDINHSFVAHAKKQGKDVWFGDVHDPEDYVHADTVVLIDALHHIRPDLQEEVIMNMAEHAVHQVIICDPYKDRYLKLIPSRVPGGQFLLEKWYDLIDNDGQGEARLSRTPLKSELEEKMRSGFGILPIKGMTLHEIGEDLIATYRT